MRKLSALIVLVLSVAAPAHAESVEDATNRYLEVMKSGDYTSIAQVFDPAELKKFRRSLAFLVDAPDSSRNQLYTSFFGPGSTQESVDQLSDEEFFSSFFRFVMAQAGMDDLMSTAELEYLGHVMEGDDVAHAVTRVSANVRNTKFEQMSVVSLVRKDDRWMMKLSGEIESVAGNIRSALGMSK